MHSFGSNTVNQNLTLGFESTGSGIYRLKDGTLAVGDADIGFEGTGTVRQVGGSHTVNWLTFGELLGSSGTYRLKGGTLAVGDADIGNYGIGSFIQIGGSHTVDNRLYLGTSATGSGTGPNNATSRRSPS